MDWTYFTLLKTDKIKIEELGVEIGKPDHFLLSHNLHC